MPDSYVVNSHVVPREGEHLFHHGKDGRVTVSLNGYAVIPLEDYYKLTPKPDKEEHRRVPKFKKDLETKGLTEALGDNMRPKPTPHCGNDKECIKRVKELATIHCSAMHYNMIMSACNQLTRDLENEDA